jgi:hypothetical protein
MYYGLDTIFGKIRLLMSLGKRSIVN